MNWVWVTVYSVQLLLPSFYDIWVYDFAKNRTCASRDWEMSEKIMTWRFTSRPHNKAEGWGSLQEQITEVSFAVPSLEFSSTPNTRRFFGSGGRKFSCLWRHNVIASRLSVSLCSTVGSCCRFFLLYTAICLWENRNFCLEVCVTGSMKQMQMETNNTTHPWIADMTCNTQALTFFIP